MEVRAAVDPMVVHVAVAPIAAVQVHTAAAPIAAAVHTAAAHTAAVRRVAAVPAEAVAVAMADRQVVADVVAKTIFSHTRLNNVEQNQSI